MHMLEETANLIGMKVYSPKGIYLGAVSNLVLDLSGRRVDGIFLDNTSPVLVEGSHPVNVPYRWIQSVGDVIILKKFPDRVVPSEGDLRSDL
ncbi:MAG: PRC-barrel domain-containing protein [Candidatus Methanomethylophilaceae archaeon]|nr:PRC-barrel domain-containing protein [Candidatus Methanomethylophilaceae archaeon]NCB64410.1 photosystem reaction center subunit H [Clostridia bacterium]